MVIPFLVLAIIMAVIYIIAEMTLKPLIALFVKALASLSFILLGVSRLILNQGDDPLMIGFILMGLASGMIGDIVLALRPLRPKAEDKLIIVLGIISFSIGHIFYLIGLTTIQSLSMLSFVIGGVAAIIVVVMSYVMKFKMGIARIPSYLYALMIFTMIGQSIVLFQYFNQYLPFLLLMIGAILFGVSDLILAPIYFSPKYKRIMIVFNLASYYGAQILIALSLFYM